MTHQPSPERGVDPGWSHRRSAFHPFRPSDLR